METVALGKIDTVDSYENAAFCILVIFTLIVLHIELIFNFSVPQ